MKLCLGPNDDVLSDFLTNFSWIFQKKIAKRRIFKRLNITFTPSNFNHFDVESLIIISGVLQDDDASTS